MSNFSRPFSSALFALTAWTALAQGPENVLLVINRNSPVSRQIGDYYARRRAIPASNVCAIAVSVGDSVDRLVYNKDIEGPIGACLDTLKAKTIAYIVLTKGLPFRIPGTGGMSGKASSVDGELAALYARRLGRTLTLEGPLPNPYYRQAFSKFDQKRFPIYMVARLSAYDFATVKRMIDDARVAENKGKFVIDMKSGESDNAGDKWLGSASLVLPRARVVVDSGTDVLHNQTDVIAYAAWGSNDPSRRRRQLGFHWLPGSVATEFVSTNGRSFDRPPAAWTFGKWEDNKTFYGGSPQSLAADYLDEGASAATGHDDEPFLQYCPHPDYMLPAYNSGRTLGESFYVATPAISWHNMLLGDPLMTLAPPK